MFETAVPMVMQIVPQVKKTKRTHFSGYCAHPSVLGVEQQPSAYLKNVSMTLK